MALSPEMIQEYLDKTSKCSLSWQLVQATKIWKDNWCIQDLELILKNESWYFKAIWFFNNWECILDTFHEQIFANDAKIWNNYNFVLDENFKILIDLWNKKNIETCTWNEVNYENNIFLNNYLIFWIWILIILSIWLIFFKKKKNPI